MAQEGLEGDDPALQLDLAECYVASGYANDARTHFETAMRLWIGAGKALSGMVRRIAKEAETRALLSPEDVAAAAASLRA